VLFERPRIRISSGTDEASNFNSGNRATHLSGFVSSTPLQIVNDGVIYYSLVPQRDGRIHSHRLSRRQVRGQESSYSDEPPYGCQYQGVPRTGPIQKCF
jgi:hypothetical protein